MLTMDLLSEENTVNPTGLNWIHTYERLRNENNSNSILDVFYLCLSNGGDLLLQFYIILNDLYRAKVTASRDGVRQNYAS